MRRQRLLVTIASMIVMLGSGGTDLNACGDKFLRIGRSPRFKAYAAVHRASILLFVPPSATRSAVNEFESALKRAGHRPLTVRTMNAFSDALGATKYDIVIAIFPDAVRLKEYAAAASSKPDVLPILDRPAKAELAEAQREYGHVLKAGATKYETLAEIDHVMQGRLTGRP
jgi:hypothetical protein